MKKEKAGGGAAAFLQRARGCFCRKQPHRFPALEGDSVFVRHERKDYYYYFKGLLNIDMLDGSFMAWSVGRLSEVSFAPLLLSVHLPSVLVGSKRSFPSGSDGKRICLQCRRPGFDPWVGRIPWRREWQPTPVFLPGETHGQRSLGVIVHGFTKSWTQLK